MLIGYCAFGTNDAALLVSLLPDLVVVRAASGRLMTPGRAACSEEAHAGRPGRDVGACTPSLKSAVHRGVSRSGSSAGRAPGLLRGLADERLAAALRRMHGEPTRPWTIGDLAKEAALSRSTFFDRFRREVGVAPMEYLLGWRLAIAKDLLRAATGLASARLRSWSATVPRAHSVSHSRAKWVCFAFDVRSRAWPRHYWEDRSRP